MSGEKRSHSGREQEPHEPQKSRSQRGHGNGSLEKRAHPAEEKPPQRAKAAIEVNIRPAGLGKRGAQFRITERAEENNKSANKPRGEYQSRGADGASHIAGNKENARADGVTNDDGSGRPDTQAPD